MKVVESGGEIRSSYEKLKSQCAASAGAPKTVEIVRASAKRASVPVHVLGNEGIWAAFDEARDDRYRCLFGTGDPEEQNRCVIEVNLPREGRAHNFGGLFLRDDQGKVHLARVGGLSGQEKWREFLKGYDGQVVEVDDRPAVLVGALGSSDFVASLGRFVTDFAKFREQGQDEPTGTAWRDHLWAIFQERAEVAGSEVRLPVYWKGLRDRRIDAMLVGEALRVRVTQEMIDKVDTIPRGFVEALPEAHQRHWRWAADAIRKNLGKTVSLNQYGGCICIPTENPDRRSTALNVYAFFHVDPKDEEFSVLLTPEERAALAAAMQTQEQETLPLNRFGHFLYRLAGDLAGDDDEIDGGEEDEEEEDEEESVWSRHRNVIFFGPPGTGKSHQVQEIVTKHLAAKAEHVKRVTFHPEYSYFDFVGSYRPAVGWLKTTAQFIDADGIERDREPRTYYRFEPGPFSQALALAAKMPDEPVVLVIEEINRGNCAAVFGDVFQLLDRIGDPKTPEREGWSQYAVVPSAEWSTWLEQNVPKGSQVFDAPTSQLRLPGNLYLYATMNTSDQSLFPMDTAFRRRWGMAYQGVDTPRQPTAKVRLHAADEAGVPWMTLMQTLNRAIVDHTRSDDKQMGPWFIRPPVGESVVDAVEFKSKVLFYLWATVFRDRPGRVFRGKVTTYEALLARYDQGRHVFQKEIVEALGLQDQAEPDGEAASET